MVDLKSLVLQLNVSTEHKVLCIREVHEAGYIGEHQFNIFFEDKGIKFNYRMPEEIGRAIRYGKINWMLINDIDTFIKEIKSSRAKILATMLETSSKRRTRMELNKMLVRGHYEKI